MKIFDCFLKFLGFEVDNSEKTISDKKQENVVKSSFDLKNDDLKLNTKSTLNNLDLTKRDECKTFIPKKQEDVQFAIDELKRNGEIKLDISNINDEDIQRIMDFLMGSIYALNGKMSNIENNIYYIEQGESLEK